MTWTEATLVSPPPPSHMPQLSPFCGKMELASHKSAYLKVLFNIQRNVVDYINAIVLE